MLGGLSRLVRHASGRHREGEARRTDCLDGAVSERHQSDVQSPRQQRRLGIVSWPTSRARIQREAHQPVAPSTRLGLPTEPGSHSAISATVIPRTASSPPRRHLDEGRADSGSPQRPPTDFETYPQETEDAWNVLRAGSSPCSPWSRQRPPPSSPRPSHPQPLRPAVSTTYSPMPTTPKPSVNWPRTAS